VESGIFDGIAGIERGVGRFVGFGLPRGGGRYLGWVGAVGVGGFWASDTVRVKNFCRMKSTILAIEWDRILSERIFDGPRTYGIHREDDVQHCKDKRDVGFNVRQRFVRLTLPAFGKVPFPVKKGSG